MARRTPTARTTFSCQPLEPRRLLAASLVQDINPATEGSQPEFLAAPGAGPGMPAGRAAFFRAQTNTLYGTDAAPASAAPIRQNLRLIDSAHAIPFPAPLTAAAGGFTFFVAQDVLPDGSTGPARLWHTNATAGGTAPFFDLPPGDPTQYYLSAAGNTVYLSTPAESVNPDGTYTGHGARLYRFVPGSPGMALVREFNSPRAPAGMVDFRGKIYFAGYSAPLVSRTLWSTDGTAANTVEVTATGPGAGMNVASIPVVAGNFLYFGGATAAAGTEPWRSDGTAAGTTQIGNIAPGTASAGPLTFAALPSGQAMFTTGGKLYKDLGSNYTMIFAPGNFNPVYESLYRAGNTVYIRVTEPNVNRVLWKTDGTDAGTVRLADTSPNDSNGSGVTFLGELNGKLLFSGFTTDIGEELWTSDGTTAGTRMVSDIDPTPVWGPYQASYGSSDPYNVVVTAGRAFFAADDGVHGREPFVTDGTDAGTRMVADVNLAPLDSNPGAPFIGSQGAAVLDGVAWFSTGSYLTRSDGTAAGTSRVKWYPGATVKHVTAWNGSIYFVWDSGIGEEVLRFGGGGGVPDVSLVYGSTPDYKRDFFVPWNGKLYFFANSGLWSTDGTAAGTVRVTSASTTISGANWLTAAGDELFFVAGGELWVSNGTAAGTRRFSAAVPGATTTSVREVLAIGDVLYYTAGQQTTLYRTDGTAAGTTMLSEPTTTGRRVSFWAASSLARLGDTLYFSASDAAGTGLWKSDGTRAATAPVARVLPPNNTAVPRWVTAAGDRVYFAGYDEAHGYELWTSDGTAAGTRRLSDVNPGPADAFPSAWLEDERWHLFAAGEHLFFTAQGADGTFRIWEVSDKGGGVSRVTEGFPSDPQLVPFPLAVVRPPGAPADAPVLLFADEDATHGRELWSAPAGPLPPGVAGRYTFYNDSAFDGASPAADVRDDAAIAIDKTPLRPGEPATIANVTSFTRGLTGIMVDIANLPAGGVITPDDFSTRIGRTGDPSTWPAGPLPAIVSVRRGAGASASDRVTLTFEGAAVRNTWLQVTVKANSRTGLVTPDVFTFGNLVGETASLTLDARDAFNTRAAIRPTAATVTNPYDHNRDGVVNVLDYAAALRNIGASLQWAPPLAAVAPSATATRFPPPHPADPAIDPLPRRRELRMTSNLPPSLPRAPLDYADPARCAPPRFDGYVFASHLVGWAVFGGIGFAIVVWVVPRFEDVFKDFKISLPEATMTLLSLSRLGVLLPLVLVSLAIAHAFAAAAWHPRSTRPGRFLYRLVLTLLLGAIVAFICIALFLPYVTLMSGISGSAGGSKR